MTRLDSGVSSAAGDGVYGLSLQAAREHAVTCTATAERCRFGTHSAYAEPDGSAVACGCHFRRPLYDVL
jgi:hypothetical protein